MRSNSERSAESPNDLYLAAARRFEDLFDGIPIACLTFDASGTIYEWNRAAETLWELSAAQAMQQPLSGALRHSEGEATISQVLDQVFRGDCVRDTEWHAEFEGGRFKWILANAFPLRAPDGRITGAVMAAADITAQKELQHQVEAQVLELHEAHIQLEQQRDELAEANAKLEALATSDGLTGLKNHRAFQEYLEQQFRIAHRSGAPLSVLLLDVDHFKQLNDTHGHPAGDEVLMGIGEILTQTARRSDFVARYGGEEFVIVLPDTDALGAMEAGERFRHGIASRKFSTGPVTASIGAASILPDDPDRARLIARADEALYASKRNGRNQVRHAESLPLAA